MSSAYDKWIAANDKLIKCFNSVGAEKFAKMSPNEQNSVCNAEREAVQSILKNDEIHFRNLIKERLQFAGAYDFNQRGVDRANKKKKKREQEQENEHSSLTMSENSKNKTLNLKEMKKSKNQQNDSSTQSIQLFAPSVFQDKKNQGISLLQKENTLMQQSFLSSYSNLNHFEKKISKNEKYYAGDKENQQERNHKKQARKKASCHTMSLEGLKVRQSKNCATISLLNKKQRKVFKEDINEYGVYHQEKLHNRHNDSQTSQELKDEYMKLKKQLRQIEQTQSQDSSRVRVKSKDKRYKVEKEKDQKHSKSVEGRIRGKPKNKSKNRKKDSEIVELYINLDGKQSQQFVINSKSQKAKQEDSHGKRKQSKHDKRHQTRSIDERDQFRGKLGIKGKGSEINSFQQTQQLPPFWSPSIQPMVPLSPKVPTITPIQPIYNQMMVPQIIQLPAFPNPVQPPTIPRLSLIPQNSQQDFNLSKSGYLSHRTSNAGFLNFNSSQHFRQDSTILNNNLGSQPNNINQTRQFMEYSSEKNLMLDNTITTLKRSPKQSEHQRGLSSQTMIKAPRTENASLQCSLMKEQSKFKVIDPHKKREINLASSILSNDQSRIDSDKKSQRFSIGYQLTFNENRKHTVITEESQSIPNSKKCSFLIAENVLESPKERDFRDNKNVNIYMINELDTICKPGHHDFQDNTPANVTVIQEEGSAMNGGMIDLRQNLKLPQKQLQFEEEKEANCKQIFHKDESTRQMTREDIEIENSIQQLHQVQYNKKPKEQQEEQQQFGQTFSEEFSNDSFIEIPNERKSIRRQVNHYNDQSSEEQESRSKNLIRHQICRSRSQENLVIQIPCSSTSSTNQQANQNQQYNTSEPILQKQDSSSQKTFFPSSKDLKTVKVPPLALASHHIKIDLYQNEGSLTTGRDKDQREKMAPSQASKYEQSNPRSRMSNFSNNQTITTIPFNKTNNDISFQNSFHKDSKNTTKQLIIIEKQIPNTSNGTVSQRNSLADAFKQRKPKLVTRLESEKRRSVVSANPYNFQSSKQNEHKMACQKKSQQTLSSQRDDNSRVSENFKLSSKPFWQKQPMQKNLNKKSCICAQMSNVSGTSSSLVGTGLVNAGVTKEDIKKVPVNQLQIVDRLVRGLKAEINMIDVKKQASKNYSQLPEQKIKKTNDERKSIAKARIDNIKAYDMKMRGKHQIK